MTDLHPTPSHISLRSCEPTLPLQGRAIAYGNSRVPSAAWPALARVARSSTTESDREQTRIEERTLARCSWRGLFRRGRRTSTTFICDTPALQGRVRNRARSQLKHTFAFPRRDAPEVLLEILAPSENRGRRECRAPGAPALACAMVELVSTRVSQVTPKTPGIPHAMVYGLLRALPGDRALLPPSPADHSANLTPASRRQDHTTLPSASAPFVKGASTSTASRPASVTIASRPSCGTGWPWI